jgi:hypothetical protein
MRILAIVSGEYGERHVSNIRDHGPGSWSIEVWKTPALLPPMIDYPEDYIPEEFPPADLVLSFAELKGVAELVPDIVRLAGARAVIASVDNEAWLPRGLARQLRGWLEDMGVTCVTPKPLCSLTEDRYGVSRGTWTEYQDELIAEFARYFGKPELDVSVDPESRAITAASVTRDAVCGAARYTAERLVGVSADDAAEQAGLLHHHFPCLASMGIDSDFGDTLMHVSGNVLKDNVADQVKPYRDIKYLAPGELSE